MRLIAALGTLLLAVFVGASANGQPPRPSVLANWTFVMRGPAGGTVAAGVIPDPHIRGPVPSTFVYLPPHALDGGRYPVLYLLHGLPGSAWEYIYSLRLARTADRLIAAGHVRPFIVVIPQAGLGGHYGGEWTGIWERHVVRSVIPWVDAHLPTLADPADRAIAGLSAGGYGAVDIALRHPTVFGSIESWGGYFHPRRDGTLAYADSTELAAHDPVALVRDVAPVLREQKTRFFLSSGPSHGDVYESDTIGFADELRDLGFAPTLWLTGDGARMWKLQFDRGLAWTFPAGRQQPLPRLPSHLFPA
jgi:S-formylglutathione hydrolase FrmB